MHDSCQPLLTGRTPRRGERWSQAGICAAKQRADSGARTGLGRRVFLTIHEEADFARAVLDAGGLGYLGAARFRLPGLLTFEWIRPLRHGWRRLTMVQRLVLPRLFQTTC